MTTCGIRCLTIFFDKHPYLVQFRYQLGVDPLQPQGHKFRGGIASNLLSYGTL